MKDVHHLDPSTGVEVGHYTHNYAHGMIRGKMEFTQSIESDRVSGVITQQPQTKTIVFGSRPVKLPDQVSLRLV